MNFLFGNPVKKDIDYKPEIKTESLMGTELGDREEGYHKLYKGGYSLKFGNDGGMDEHEETSKIDKMLSHLGAFSLRDIKRGVNRFKKLIDGIKIKVFLLGDRFIIS